MNASQARVKVVVISKLISFSKSVDKELVSKVILTVNSYLSLQINRFYIYQSLLVSLNPSTNKKVEGSSGRDTAMKGSNLPSGHFQGLLPISQS